MSPKKLPIKRLPVFATDEWGGKAAYRSLSPRSHEAFDNHLSPLARRRSYKIRRRLLVAIECLLILGLAIALILIVVRSGFSAP